MLTNPRKRLPLQSERTKQNETRDNETPVFDSRSRLHVHSLWHGFYYRFYFGFWINYILNFFRCKL